MPRNLAIIALAALSTGCTAAKATLHVVTAEQALARAREQDADELALYEYTLARRYLEKAREEQGYADYKTAALLAKMAADWADKSIIAIERGGRKMGVGDAGSDLSDQMVVPQVPDVPEEDISEPLPPPPDIDILAPAEGEEPVPKPKPAPDDDILAPEEGEAP